MDSFDLKGFLIENQLTPNSQQLDELNLKPAIAAGMMALGSLGTQAQTSQEPKTSITQQVNTPESIKNEWSKNLTDTQSFGEGTSPNLNFAIELANKNALKALVLKTNSSTTALRGTKLEKQTQFKNSNGTYTAFVIINSK
jgi:hypothetical protein